jgi:uncharacterized membrane protein YraQ (UPF0718 family)
MTAFLASLRRSQPVDLLAAALSDRVVLAILAVLIALALIVPGQAATSLGFVAGALASVLPFLALAVAVAGFAGASGADGVIARAFAGNEVQAVAAAALVGALSPFCSCGVIPLVAALLAAGVPLAPVMAFWIASPIMDPEMFILTAAGIGTGFAVVKTLAAVSMGLFAGYVTLGLDRAGALRSPLKQAPRCGCKPSVDTGAAPAVVWAFWHDPARRARFRGEVETTGWFLAKWLTFAFLLESLMVAWVPSDWIAGLVGADSTFALPLAVLVGMPSYLNGYAAIPLVSGLLDLGMSQGAALAFMTAGAVSSIPAAIAVYALVRHRVFALYLALGVTGALLSGLALDLSGIVL